MNPEDIELPAFRDDRFFKAFLAHKMPAREFCEAYLKPSQLQRLDLESLTRLPDTLISPELAAHYSDLLFSCRTKKGKPVKVYILLEHKTKPEFWTIFYLLILKMELWQKEKSEHRRGRGKLTPIIAVVLNQGPGRWRHSLRFEDLFDRAEAGDEFASAEMILDARLVDLTAQADIKREGLFIELGLDLMAKVRQGKTEEWLRENGPKIDMIIDKENWRELFRLMVSYMIQSAKAQNEMESVSTIIKLAANIKKKPIKEEFMTLAEALHKDGIKKGLEVGREEGWEKGREKGREEGLRKGQIIGRIITLREILGLEIGEEGLQKLSLAELERMAAKLRAQLKSSPGNRK